MTWDGRERREQRDDGRTGRRPGDQQCSEHYLLWSHHDKDKDEHRVTTCGRITKVEEAIDKEVTALDVKIEKLSNIIVGKYWFRFVIGVVFASILGLGLQQNWAFQEILTNQREFSVSVNNIATKQSQIVQQLTGFEAEIIKINKRQDVLRDIQIKTLEERKGEDGRDGRDGKVGRDGRDAKK